MAHTPGPWVMNHGWCIQAEYYENQQLCCAAPDLLAALKYLINHGLTEFEFRRLMEDPNHCARKALKKAEGADHD